MNGLREFLATLSLVLWSAAIASCDGASSGLRAGQGRLALELIDAPNPQVKEIIVTLSKVTAHSTEKGWVDIFTGNLTVDLLKLKSYAMPLGFKDLPAGKVTQLRLYVADGATQEVVLPGGEHLPLTVPSGVQSGIKIKGPFHLGACTTTTVMLDFDGHKSIWVHPTGLGDRWILRPVIHAKKVTTHQTPCTTPGEPSGGGGGSGGGGTINEGGSSCLSGVCRNGICDKGGPGAACRLDLDCQSNTCEQNGTCGPGAAGGTGTRCAANADCLSNTCVNGVCDSGNQGSPCTLQKDCTSGFSCELGFCHPLLN